MKKIGILTSGGDCGGLNAVIKGAAYMALAKGLEMYIIPNGYAGLYNLVDQEALVRLDPARLDQFSGNFAGSEAGHSRVKIKAISNPDKYNRIKEGMEKFGLDALVISGGDDSGSVMVDLNRNGIQCVHAPKTMDLDLQTYSVGGDSTINRIAQFVQDLKTTGRTHNRILVTEVFGRYAGHTAFRSGIAAEADCILIPEIPVDWDVVYEHIVSRFTRRIRQSDVNAGTYTIVVAEGMKNADGTDIVDESAGVDAFGHKKLAGAGKYVCQVLKKRLKADPDMPVFMKETGMFVEGIYEIPEVREIHPGHLVRAGNSSAYDVNFGYEAGAGAVILLSEGKSGVTISKVKGRKIEYIESEKAIEQRYVDPDQVALYEAIGICFGRNVAAYDPILREVDGVYERIY
ncbi:6-phosphofructokinase [Prosthecochloris sp. N3]|uniref:6-phosphofructokinase n=1 Tax=Prosthecochloris ethylica TaxID=2743976 RepID=A0ABR9XQI5_9CHLB|nr:6-phosphofructokinase [Prosthecochloris sp. ZM_2]MBF0586472.1 6-phosphofructokinase [Prosthecochloris ethylica]MBF0636085.1 6-phosphofructokinase [Prosthecochloris ethylica]NUK47778.1 6-phosphofructokinase [Prosthecochloris ethylica]RNA64434.1 6-phosphofructokinase [Prosthecochloris sp. ZM_2]